MKKIEEMTIEEIEKVKLLNKQELHQLEFAELCIYMENLNKLEARYKELKYSKGV